MHIGLTCHVASEAATQDLVGPTRPLIPRKTCLQRRARMLERRRSLSQGLQLPTNGADLGDQLLKTCMQSCPA